MAKNPIAFATKVNWWFDKSKDSSHVRLFKKFESPIQQNLSFSFSFFPGAAVVATVSINRYFHGIYLNNYLSLRAFYEVFVVWFLLGAWTGLSSPRDTSFAAAWPLLLSIILASRLQGGEPYLEHVSYRLYPTTYHILPLHYSTTFTMRETVECTVEYG